MGLTIVAASADTSALAAEVAAANATAQAAHDVAVKAEQDAATADAKAANARGMVISRDPRLTNLEDVASRFTTEIARTDQVHADLQAGIDREATARAAAITTEAAARKAADDAETAARIIADAALASRAVALETDVAALKALKVVVGFGVANLPSSLGAGASVNVTVTLNRSMGSPVYSVGYGLAGGTSLLGNLSATGVVSQTATTVVIAVKNNGLTALLNLSTASLSVVAARDA